MAKPMERPNGGGMAHNEGIVKNSRENGRFVSTGDSLTEMQSRFVVELVRNGGNASKAAQYAGYSAPEQQGSQLRRNPAVAAAIRAEQARQIQDGASVAWGVIKELMSDPVQPGAVRLQAAKWTLEASGHGLAAAALMLKAGDGQDRPLSEMSVAELEEHVARAGKAVEAMKSAQAQVIDAQTGEGITSGAQNA